MHHQWDFGTVKVRIQRWRFLVEMRAGKRHDNRFALFLKPSSQ